MNAVALQIIRTYETGSPIGGVGTRTYLSDGAGLSFGWGQGTDGSDTADMTCQEYVDLRGKHAALLTEPIPSSGKSVLEHLLDDDTTALTSMKDLPAWGQEILDRLGVASTDPLMATAQDKVFERYYLEPVEKLCYSLELISPLSFLALADTCIQSGFKGISTIRARFPEVPPSLDGDESIWTTAYLSARYDWLKTFKSSRGQAHTDLVRSTRYRPAAMLDLVDQKAWWLKPPASLKMPISAKTVVYDDDKRRYASGTRTVTIPG